VIGSTRRLSTTGRRTFYRFGTPRTGLRCELPDVWFNATEIHALLGTLRLVSNLQRHLLNDR
jgi:hypothetical protein